MKKNKILRIVNLLLAIDLLIIITTAAFSEYIYPTGYYRTLHVLPGTIFVALIAVHIFLNWAWIKSNYINKKR
ncbi:MAG TPA: hypothetical protein VJ990_08005 [Clostridia bacterium]|nr:hypothetical protein [Clostridia bacterium]